MQSFRASIWKPLIEAFNTLLRDGFLCGAQPATWQSLNASLHQSSAAGGGPGAVTGCRTVLPAPSKSNPTDKSAAEEFTITVTEYASGPCCSMPKPTWSSRNACAVVNVILSTCTTVVRKEALSSFFLFSNQSPCLMFLAYRCGQLSLVLRFIPHKWTRKHFIIIAVLVLNQKSWLWTGGEGHP